VNLLIGGWIKVGICLYAACLGIAQIANLQDYKPLVLPVTIICVSLAIWLYENIFEMLVWAAEIYPYYAVPFQFGIPVLLLVIPKIKSWMKSNEGIRQRMPEQSAGKQGDKE
jgi:spore germination protein KB